MISYLLDTSIYSQRLMRRPNSAVITHWRAIGDQALAVSSVCETEILFGLEKKNSQRLWLEYDHYLKDRLVLIPFGRKEAIIFSKIKNQMISNGKIISGFDLLIGATAKANGLILATLNVKHFMHIEGLAVENWNIDSASHQ